MKTNNMMLSSSQDDPVSIQPHMLLKELDQHNVESSRGSLSEKALLLGLAGNEGSVNADGSLKDGEGSNKTKSNQESANLTQNRIKKQGNHVKQVLREFEKQFGGNSK